MPAEDIYPAVELLAPPPTAQFAREKQAFWAMHEAMLQQYEGQYVAVYEGKVVDSDQDKVALALRIYRTYGYVPIFVHLVSRHASPVRSIYSPHLSTLP